MTWWSGGGEVGSEDDEMKWKAILGFFSFNLVTIINVHIISYISNVQFHVVTSKPIKFCIAQGRLCY